MNLQEVTLLNMVVRSIRDDPKNYQHYADELIKRIEGDKYPDLKRAIKSLCTRLDRVVASGVPLLFYEWNMASIIEYTGREDEVEKCVIAALRSVVRPGRGE